MPEPPEVPEWAYRDGGVLVAIGAFMEWTRRSLKHAVEGRAEVRAQEWADFTKLYELRHGQLEKAMGEAAERLRALELQVALVEDRQKAIHERLEKSVST